MKIYEHKLVITFESKEKLELIPKTLIDFPNGLLEFYEYPDEDIHFSYHSHGSELIESTIINERERGV